jgi:sugar phosphate isomerase/epimerase
MRICYNDGFGGKVRNIDADRAKFYTDIGFHTVGINSGDADATDAEIDHAKALLADHSIYPGPFGGGRTVWHPDPDITKRYKQELTRVLRTAGRLGCPSIRISGGSYNLKDRWMHHPKNVTQEAMDIFVKHTRDLVPVAEDNGVCICPETTQFTIINTIGRMKEYVDRCDSDYVKIIFDPVNHTTAERLYDTGTYVKTAIAELGERIAVIHVKDVTVQDTHLVVHIDEAPMGTGVMDHAALMQASTWLEPWKTFSLEHIRSKDLIKPAYDHIMAVAERSGHTFTDPSCTRERWQQGACN